MSSRKLRHYFEAHRILIVISQPLHDLFSNREASNRISKWVAELLEFYVDFERRTAIKSQVLANFIVDWTSPTSNKNHPLIHGLYTVTRPGARMVWGSQKSLNYLREPN